MAFNAFLKIDGIDSGTQGGEIPLRSFTWGLSNSSSSGSGSGAGRVSFQDFSFVASVGKQSPQLFEATAEGKVIQSATLTVTDKIEPLTIKFSEVFISSYKLDEGVLKLSEGALPAVQFGAPSESVSFNFGKVEFQVGGNIGSGRVSG